MNTSANEVMFSSEFVCLYLCVHDNSKMNKCIYMKVFVMVGPKQWKKGFNFGKDLDHPLVTKQN